MGFLASRRSPFPPQRSCRPSRSRRATQGRKPAHPLSLHFPRPKRYRRPRPDSRQDRSKSRKRNRRHVAGAASRLFDVVLLLTDRGPSTLLEHTRVNRPVRGGRGAFPQDRLEPPTPSRRGKTLDLSNLGLNDSSSFDQVKSLLSTLSASLGLFRFGLGLGQSPLRVLFELPETLLKLRQAFIVSHMASIVRTAGAVILRYTCIRFSRHRVGVSLQQVRKVLLYICRERLKSLTNGLGQTDPLLTSQVALREVPISGVREAVVDRSLKPVKDVPRLLQRPQSLYLIRPLGLRSFHIVDLPVYRLRLAGEGHVALAVSRERDFEVVRFFVVWIDPEDRPVGVNVEVFAVDIDIVAAPTLCRSRCEVFPHVRNKSLLYGSLFPRLFGHPAAAASSPGFRNEVNANALDQGSDDRAAATGCVTVFLRAVGSD